MGNIRYIKAIVLSIAWISLGGCSPQKKASHPVEVFADLFFELAQATQQAAGDTIALQQRHEAIFRTYHITPEEVEQAIKEYEQHPEEWGKILQKMSEKQKAGK